MVCPYCQQATRVINSRPRKTGFSVWRRRHCSTCPTTFTTIEQLVIESIIVLKGADGTLKPLRYSDAYASIFKALGASKTMTEPAEHLTQTCINKLLKQQQPVLEQNFVQQQIYETLQAYESLAGQRYLIEERGEIEPNFNLRSDTNQSLTN